jgi:uncharacterized protein YqgV (UPF0045/DUF77 family)
VPQVRVEFTVEPFVEGHPGPHVLAAIEAVRQRGLDVEIGPFSTITDVPADLVGATVAELLQAGLDHGATRISLQVGAIRTTRGPGEDAG